MILASSFDKRHLVDLAQSSDAGAGFFERRIAQERHALLARHAPDLGGRPPVQNHLANDFGKIEQFVNRAAAAVSGAAALEAPGAFKERDFAPIARIQPAFAQFLVGGLLWSLAVLA